MNIAYVIIKTDSIMVPHRYYIIEDWHGILNQCYFGSSIITS